MSVCIENQIYLNFVDSGQLDIFCTIKVTGSFVTVMITKAQYICLNIHIIVR